ncbi:MAG TPA: 2Fe-2S iron-sulfur cluster binding domain-containing protein [Candidatus Thalassarchaeaceae archaeon]|nr:MAG TPA: hypothetical protein D7H85_04465 [Candidatus Poseidoniales archaeon]HII49123.1 2Fe-2S iron-sulfur cluster binding domain-containing protein [Candidatus Thalassarchaeaceae archaeon]
MSKPVVRFRRASLPLATIEVENHETLLEAACKAGLEAPSNCNSGTCGTCMITLLSGDVPLPEILPPGLDDYMVEQGARLGCIGMPADDCKIDIRPPL